MDKLFADRAEAGSVLAHVLRHLAPPDPVVIALPGGGVPVAAKVAHSLPAPLDLLLGRDIAAPDRPALTVASVFDGAWPDIVLDDEAMTESGATAEYVQEMVPGALHELARRRRRLLGSRRPLPLQGHTAVLVDDGDTPPARLRAAIEALRQHGPAGVVLAVPVAASAAVAHLSDCADTFVCVEQRPAASAGYTDFPPISDEDVAATLESTP